MSRFFELLRKRHHKIFAGLAILVTLIGSNCSFEKPSAPSWDVEVVIPLISKVYTVAELADDESSLSVDSTGMLNLQVDADLDEYYVGDQLDFDDIEQAFSLTLGTFSVDSPGSEFTSISLREIYSQADALDGQTVVVPGFSFESPKRTLDPYEGYSYAIIESGQIELAVSNNLAVPLGSPLTLEIWHSVLDTLVFSTTTSTQIRPGTTETIILDLAGKKLPNQLAIRMTGDSPGSDGSIVTVNASSDFEVTADIGEMQVREAYAEIPAQTISKQDEVYLDDSIVIVEAQIESGTLELEVSGNFAVDSWIVYELPDLVAATGSALVDSFFIFNNNVPPVSIDLSGYSFRPEIAGFGNQTTRFEWTAKTVDTGSNLVLVSSSDQFDANISLSGVTFSQVSGKLASEEIDITQDEIQFDLPADMDSIFFETARLELSINNGINFPANLDFVIEGRNESGAVSSMTVQESIQPALQPGVPVTTVILLDQQNSNIKEFISILPSLVRVAGKVRLGDENWIGTVSKNDFVNGTVRITAPVAFRLASQEVETDVNEVVIGDDVKDDVIENIGSGSFFAEISNHLPLGVSVEVMFGQDPSTVYQSSILRVGPIDADPASVDASGFVSQARTSEISINLSEEEMRTFLRSPLYAGVRVLVDGTNNEFVRVRGSDFIQIKAYSKINVKVNQD